MSHSLDEIKARVVELQQRLVVDRQKLKRSERRAINVEINALQQEAWALQREAHRMTKAERREENRRLHWERVNAETERMLAKQRAPKVPTVDPDEQALADRMGITVEHLHEIQRQRRKEIADLQSRGKGPYGGLEDALSRAPVIGKRRSHDA